MRVNVNAAIGVQKAMNLPNMLNARQYCDVWAKAVGNSVNGSLPNLANPEVYAGADVTRTDWLDEIFRTGMTQHYGISLSGGTEKISSILSVTYDKKEGFGACFVRIPGRTGQGQPLPHRTYSGRHVVPLVGFGV